MPPLTQELRVFVFVALVAFAVTLSFIFGAAAVRAQEDCIRANSEVQVCGAVVSDGALELDVRASSPQRVAVAVASARESEGHAPTVMRNLDPGQNNVSVPAPGSSVRWSVGNMQGFAFGEAGTPADVGPATWLIALSMTASAALGVLATSFIAALTTFYGSTDYRRRLW